MIANRGTVRQEESGWRVTFERRFKGTPEELWPFLTEAEHLSEWITPGVTIDAREGGRIAFPWPAEAAMEGEITVFDPPRLIEYLWNEGAVRSRVRMELRPNGSDTLLVVDHAGLPERDSSGFAAGWHAHLDWLEAGRAGGGGGFDQKARFNELASEYGWQAPVVS